MTVTENMSYLNFDEDENNKKLFWIKPRLMRQRATQLVKDFKVKTTSIDSPIAALSGGNVQRAVLARELTGSVDLLIISNPCFGLDFSAVAEIRSRIMSARNSGTAVLLISEDLDEILELSDRILVMSEGKIVYETSIEDASVEQIGHYMAGHS
jgi:general nucleoside transport system ATP-binding protein